MSAVIVTEKCIACGICEGNCPGDIIYIDEQTQKAWVKYPDECWHCGSCRLDCPAECISFEFPMEMVI